MAVGTGTVAQTVKHLSEIEQFPLNVVGPKGPHSFFGSHQGWFSGTTGMVSTSYGIPGVTIGRTRTGVYTVKFPPIQHVSIHPALQVPSGSAYDVHVKGLSGAVEVVGKSGYAEVHISRQSPSGIGLNMPQNPPTGTVLDLLFHASTSSPLGF